MYFYFYAAFIPTLVAVRGEAYINGHGNKLALCMIKETTLDLFKTMIFLSVK